VGGEREGGREREVQKEKERERWVERERGEEVGSVTRGKSKGKCVIFSETDRQPPGQRTDLFSSDLADHGVGWWWWWCFGVPSGIDVIEGNSFWVRGVHACAEPPVTCALPWGILFHDAVVELGASRSVSLLCPHGRHTAAQQRYVPKTT